MKRGAYVGDAGVLGGAGVPAIPQQFETGVYLSRFSTFPGLTYREALNELIFKAKRAGVWTLVQDLWLFVADTQADSLRNVISASRDATITGSLTFTANQGFTGHGVSNYLNMPFSTSGVTAVSGFFWALTAVNNQSIGLILGSNSSYGGALEFDNNGTFSIVRPGNCTDSGDAEPYAMNPGAVITYVGATADRRVITPTAIHSQWSSGTTVNLTTSPVTTNSTKPTRFMAWGVMPSATTTQVRKFLVFLQQFLEDVGAL